jgi:hypothetical protein
MGAKAASLLHNLSVVGVWLLFGLVQAVLPASLAVVVAFALWQPPYLIGWLLPALLEVVFAGYYWIFEVRRLNQPAATPSTGGREERAKLLKSALSTVTDLDGFLSGWFYGSELKEIGR